MQVKSWGRNNGSMGPAVNMTERVQTDIGLDTKTVERKSPYRNLLSSNYFFLFLCYQFLPLCSCHDSPGCHSAVNTAIPDTPHIIMLSGRRTNIVTRSCPGNRRPHKARAVCPLGPGPKANFPLSLLRWIATSEHQNTR